MVISGVTLGLPSRSPPTQFPNRRGTKADVTADVAAEQRTLHFGGVATAGVQRLHRPPRVARLWLGVVHAAIRARAANAMHLLGRVDEQKEQCESARRDGERLDRERFDLREQLLE